VEPVCCRADHGKRLGGGFVGGDEQVDAVCRCDGCIGQDGASQVLTALAGLLRVVREPGDDDGAALAAAEEAYLQYARIESIEEPPAGHGPVALGWPSGL
jgi:hypothetical protein